MARLQKTHCMETADRGRMDQKGRQTGGTDRRNWLSIAGKQAVGAAVAGRSWVVSWAMAGLE